MKTTGVNGLRRSARQTGATGRRVAGRTTGSDQPAVSHPVAAASNHLAVEGPAVMSQGNQRGMGTRRSELICCGGRLILLLASSSTIGVTPAETVRRDRHLRREPLDGVRVEGHPGLRLRHRASAAWPRHIGSRACRRCPNAGGIGRVRLLEWPAPDHVREMIRRTRSLTARPFGVALFLASPQEEILKAVLEEKVAVLQVYWGDFPRERVEEAHRASVKVLHQIGSLEDAEKAKEAGLDGIIVQGCEAGGH